MKHVMYVLNPEVPLWTLELDYIYPALLVLSLSAKSSYSFSQAFKKKSYALKVESEVVLS